MALSEALKVESRFINFALEKGGMLGVLTGRSMNSLSSVTYLVTAFKLLN